MAAQCCNGELRRGHRSRRFRPCLVGMAVSARARLASCRRPGLGAVPALRKWNERQGQLVIIRGGLQGGHAFRADLFGRGRSNGWDKSGGPSLELSPIFGDGRAGQAAAVMG